MKKILTILLTISTVLAYSQSFNIKSQYSLGNLLGGVSLSLDEKPVIFETGLYLDQNGQIHNQIKAGLHLKHTDEPVRSRFMFYPIWLDGKLGGEESNHFTVAHSLEFTRPTKIKNNYLIWCIGASMSKKADKEMFPYKDFKILPHVSLEYSFGKRYYSDYKKVKEPIAMDMGVNWNKFNTASLILGIVNGMAAGGIEVIRAEPQAFQAFVKAGPYDWGGVNDWERNYYHNRYRNEDGSINKHKPEWFGNFGRDADHTLKDVFKVSRGLYGIGIGASATQQIQKTINLYKGTPRYKKELTKTILQELGKAAFCRVVSSLTEQQIYEHIRANY